jgi:hypothetical protein
VHPALQLLQIPGIISPAFTKRSRAATIRLGRQPARHSEAQGRK